MMTADLNRQLRSYGDVVTEQLDTVTMEMIMQTTDPTVTKLEPAEQPTNRWQRNLVVAAAIFVLLVAAGVAISFVLDSEGDVVTPAPPFESAEEAAYVFLEVAEGDQPYGTYAAMFAEGAPDGHLSLTGIAEADLATEARERLAATRAASWDMEFDSCEGSELQVQCEGPVLSGSLVAIQEQPFRFRLSLTLDEEGRIASLFMTPITGSSNVEGAFAAWMEDRYPDIADQFYRQILGTKALTRPVEDIIADLLAAEQEWLAE